MDSLWRTALWQQFGATVDMLEQEHAAQLNLFLGQHAIEGTSDWVPQAKVDEDDQ